MAREACREESGKRVREDDLVLETLTHILTKREENMMIERKDMMIERKDLTAAYQDQTEQRVGGMEKRFLFEAEELERRFKFESEELEKRFKLEGEFKLLQQQRSTISKEKAMACKQIKALEVKNAEQIEASDEKIAELSAQVDQFKKILGHDQLRIANVAFEMGYDMTKLFRSEQTRKTHFIDIGKIATELINKHMPNVVVEKVSVQAGRMEGVQIKNFYERDFFTVQAAIMAWAKANNIQPTSSGE